MSKLTASIDHFQDYIDRDVFKKRRKKKVRGFMRKQRQAQRREANREPIQWFRYSGRNE